jgi:glycosyltransferase involved in cell wall biosynthesis
MVSAKMDSRQPTVSVLVPTYNRAEPLERALILLIKQTYSNMEIVVSDNCSSDGTKQIVQELSRLDSRIKYFRQIENVGVVENFNLLLKKFSMGEYVIFHPDDDCLIMENYIEKAVDIIVKNKNIVFVHAGFSAIRQIDSSVQCSVVADFDEVENGVDFWKKFDLGSVLFTTFVLKKELFLNFHGNNNVIEVHPMEAINKMALVGNVGYIKDVAINYSIHDGQLTKGIEDNFYSYSDVMKQNISFYTNVSRFAAQRELEEADITIWYEKHAKKFVHDIYHGFVKPKEEHQHFKQQAFLDEVCICINNNPRHAVLVYGNGMFGKEVVKHCKDKALRVDAVIDDNNFDSVMGLSVCSLKQVLNSGFAKEPIMIVIASMKLELVVRIQKNICESGLAKSGDIVLSPFTL